VRRALALNMVGEEKVYDSVNILFQGELTQLCGASRRCALFCRARRPARATFLTINGTDRWVFFIHAPSNMAGSRKISRRIFCRALIRQGGRPAGPQDRSARHQPVGGVRYRRRPFTASATCSLTGDAAHEMPPTGGFGMNTGVQAFRTWPGKSQRCCAARRMTACSTAITTSGHAYGTLVTENALANAMSMGRTEKQSKVLPRQQFLNEQGLIFGQHISIEGYRAGRNAANARRRSRHRIRSRPAGLAAARRMSG
jgi:hypothetical protein